MTHVVILGGGSAGCVLAARVSENPAFRVTLVEAGRDIALETMPPAIRSRYPGRAYLDTRNIWAGLQALMGTPRRNSVPRMVRRYEQARILGGGSAINALLANRGAPADYDEWERLGAAGWGWEECLPYFRKLERDCDFDGSLHGQDGPLPIRRLPRDRLAPFVAAVSDTLAALGYPFLPDQNGPWDDGVFPAARVTSDAGERVPTSVGYLTTAVRSRPNLRILSDRLALRVVFEGRRATGATLATADGGAEETVAADEVVVAAGAIHSPAMLMRSGVGPGTMLQGLDIAVVADRRGVGRNLMEHPSIAVSAYLPPQSRVADAAEHHEQAIVRFSSGLAGAPPGDMHGAILSRSAWHSIGRRLGTLFFWVNKSYSKGEVTLASPHPSVEPVIDFRMLSDPRDLTRLKGALRLGAETLAHPAMQGICDSPFPTSFAPRVARVAAPGMRNALQRGTFSALLDVSASWRPGLIRAFITEGVVLAALLEDDAVLTDFITRNVGGTWHPTGTCRMGAADDRLAVTDASGRVLAVDGLRVCDASLMPSIPCANTNAPTVMIAERIADMMKRELL